MVDLNTKSSENKDNQNINPEALHELGKLHEAGILRRLASVAGLGALHHEDEKRKLSEFLGGEAIHHADEHKFGLLLGAKEIHDAKLGKIASLILTKKLVENSGKVACALKAIAGILGLSLVLAIIDRSKKESLLTGLFAGSTFEKTKALGLGLLASSVVHHEQKKD